MPEIVVAETGRSFLMPTVVSIGMVAQVCFLLSVSV